MLHFITSKHKICHDIMSCYRQEPRYRVKVYYFYCADISFLERITKMKSNFQPKASGIFFTEALKQCFLRQNGHLSISEGLPSHCLSEPNGHTVHPGNYK